MRAHRQVRTKQCPGSLRRVARVLAILSLGAAHVAAAADPSYPDDSEDNPPVRAWGAESVPSIEDPQLGEPWADDDGERIIWPYQLPFFAQDIID